MRRQTSTRILRSRTPSIGETELGREDLFRTLANNLRVGVYLIQDRRFRFINAHVQEYAGYSEETILDREPSSFIHPSDRRKVRCNARDMLNGTRATPYEYRLMTKDGSIKWIMETVTPIMFRGEKAVLGNAMDITEQKETRESLREFDALKASILDAIPQAVVGLRNRRIIFANTAVEEVFGWKADELIGESVTLFYRNKRESDEIARYFYTTLKHQRTFVNEFYCRRQGWKGYPLPDAVFPHRGETEGKNGLSLPMRI